MDRGRGPAPVTEHGATMCARADVMAMPSRELGPRVGVCEDGRGGLSKGKVKGEL